LLSTLGTGSFINGCIGGRNRSLADAAYAPSVTTRIARAFALLPVRAVFAGSLAKCILKRCTRASSAVRGCPHVATIALTHRVSSLCTLRFYSVANGAASTAAYARYTVHVIARIARATTHFAVLLAVWSDRLVSPRACAMILVAHVSFFVPARFARYAFELIVSRAIAANWRIAVKTLALF
jgi:hypothetical protein